MAPRILLSRSSPWVRHGPHLRLLVPRCEPGGAALAPTAAVRPMQGTLASGPRRRPTGHGGNGHGRGGRVGGLRRPARDEPRATRSGSGTPTARSNRLPGMAVRGGAGRCSPAAPGRPIAPDSAFTIS